MAALPPSSTYLLEVPSIDPNRCEESHLSRGQDKEGHKSFLLLAIYNKQ